MIESSSLLTVGAIGGGGLVLGGLVGYAAKKAVKLVVVLVGLWVASLFVAQNFGILTLDPAALAGVLSTVGGALSGSSGMMAELLSIISEAGAAAGGFGGGAIIGFKKG